MPAIELHPMEAYLERLHDFAARGFDHKEFLPFLRKTLIQPASLEKYLHWKPGRYTRNLVEKTDAFELLVLCWDKGQAAPVHGHEGEKCFARVERGRLRIANYRILSQDGDRVRLEGIGAPADGGPGYIDALPDIHSVANPPEFKERAVSLHLYSRPYDECDIYDLDRGLVSRVKLLYDTVGGRPA